MSRARTLHARYMAAFPHSYSSALVFVADSIVMIQPNYEMESTIDSRPNSDFHSNNGIISIPPTKHLLQICMQRREAIIKRNYFFFSFKLINDLIITDGIKLFRPIN